MNPTLSSVVSGSPLQPVSPLGTVPGAPPRVIAEGAGLRAVEEPFLQIASLRLSRRADRDAALGALPFELPHAPNRWLGSAGRSIAHFEPNAWMLLADVPGVLPEGQAPWLVTDLSSRLAGVRLCGARSARVLAAATPVVPEASGFVRTLFAETAPVLVQRLDENDYRVLIDVSLAEFLSGWLADASRMTA